MNDALQDLWNAVRQDVLYDPSFGIVKYWIDGAWKTLGSPVGPERTDPKTKFAYQAFANGIVVWKPTGPELM